MSENATEDKNLDGQENEEPTGITLSEEEPEDKPEDSTESGEEKASEGESSDSKEEGDKGINQEAVNKKINTAIRKKKEAEEATAVERLKREEVEAQLKELQQVELPDIPEVPNYMDPDYAQKIANRDEIIVKHTQEAARRQTLADIENDKARESHEAHVAKVQESIKVFDEETVKLKLDKQTLIDSQNVVGSYMKGKQELAQFLLGQSPLNVLYLSQNLPEMEKIDKMSETNAAVYIATEIAPKALELRPKTTTTPEPPYDPKGNRTSKDKDPNEGNATYV